MDTGEITKALDGWIRELPNEAHAALERCTDLSKRIGVLRGAYAPDPDAVREVQSEFALLDLDIPVLKSLFAAIEKARSAIREIRSDPVQNLVLRSAVDEFADEYSALLDHILHVVSYRSQAIPAVSQVDQIRAWVRHRREALNLIRRVSQLAGETGHPQNAILTEVERNWIQIVQEGKTDENWLEAAQSQLAALRLEFPPVAPTPSRPVQSSAPGVEEAAPVRTAPKVTVSLLPLNDISAILAECRDLSLALRLDDSRTNAFEQRLQRLYDVHTEASIQELLTDANAYHDSLRRSALEVKEERLRVLRRRWTSFTSIYRDLTGAQTKQIVEEAESLRPETTNGLIEFFDRIDEALATIDNTVAGNHPPLATAINQAVESCRAELEKLRSHPRTLAVEDSAKKQELRLPESGHPRGTVPEEFDRLESCQDVLNELKNLQRQNDDNRTELALRAARLVKTAQAIQLAGDATESAAAERLVRQISEQDSSNGWLDTKDLALDHNEKSLDVLLRRTRERLTLSLLGLRKQNLAWIRTLAEFDLRVCAFEAKEPVPVELDGLRAAIAVEHESEAQIAIFASAAVHKLLERIAGISVQLRDRVNLPSFETHPAHDRAKNLLEDLELLPPLPPSPTLEEFVEANDLFADAEFLLDSFDEARRELPLRVQKLRERFVRLDELKAATYRKSMALRVEALLRGMERAIRIEQFEPLKFQIEYTLGLIEALEDDMELRVSAETEDLEAKVRASMSTSTNASFLNRANLALDQLKAEGHLETPSARIRKTLARLLSRGEGDMRPNL